MNPSVLSALPAAQSSNTASPAAASCDPVGGLSFVCGLKKPEDLVLLPGTRWLLTSGNTPGGGLSILDTSAKAAKALSPKPAQPSRADAALNPRCPGPPAPANFMAHGMALRPGAAPGVYRLYVVSHSEVEAIQVFSVDARGAEPALSWTGCVPLPKGMRGNGVAAFGDGTILVTVRGDVEAAGPRASPSGVTLGAVLSWTPGDAAFRQLRGTELFGANGLETSPDDKEFYVVSVETRSVVVFARADPSKPLRESRAPLTSMDNLHWTGGRLIAAGKMYDEPGCGGTRQQAVDRGQGIHDCIRGYAVVELKPATMDWSVVAYSEPNPAFDGIATAVPVDKTLWLSSFLLDRIAYRPLPGAN